MIAGTGLGTCRGTGVGLDVGPGAAAETKIGRAHV